MTEPYPPPKFANSLSVFVGDLRTWVFSSQVKAAHFFGLTHSTISRYENGHLIPRLGYLACLTQLFIDRLAQERQAIESYQEALLREVNAALLLYYPDESPFRDWNELCRIAEDYIVQQKRPGHSDRPSLDRRVDWDEAPDVSVFYGRQEELDKLARWIVTDGCRLVGVLGMGGIGKTALATKLAEQIQDQFVMLIEE
jgi:transcriptional regulator with XRE-family HTH domain